MEELQLIEKKEISDIEIEGYEAESIEIEEIPKTLEDIASDLLERNEWLEREKYRLMNERDKYRNESYWLKRYMKENEIDIENIDFESWKEDASRRDRADYDKYGAMRPEQRKEYDERLERVREEMRRRRAQK